MTGDPRLAILTAQKRIQTQKLLFLRREPALLFQKKSWSQIQHRQENRVQNKKTVTENTNCFIRKMVMSAIDFYVSSLVRRMRCIVGGAIAAKWAFVVLLLTAYLCAGHTDGALIAACFAVSYDMGQIEMTKTRYTSSGIYLGLTVLLAGVYLGMSGPVWHLLVIVSVVFALQYLRQHGISYRCDIQTLNKKKKELTEQDVEGKSEIRVVTKSGRRYTFAWNRDEVEKLLQNEKENTADAEKGTDASV